MSSRWCITFLLALTYALISLQGIGTLWDCSGHVYIAIDTARPFVYPQRYTDAIFGSVVVVAHWLTNDIRVLEACFAFAHLSVTLLAWVLCAHLLRRQSPAQQLLAALMILAVPLPGQAFVCTDVNHVAVLTPVLVVLAASRMTWRGCALFAAVAIFCALDHPASLLTFGLLTAVFGARFVLERRSPPPERAAFAVTLLVLAAAAWRFAFGLTGYEKNEMGLATTMIHFRLGLYGLPGLAMLCTYLAATTTLLARLDPGERRSAAWGRVATGSLLIAAACLLVWASDLSRWIHGDTYRKFVLPLSIPLGAVLAATALLDRRESRKLARRDTSSLVQVALGIVLFMHGGGLLVQATTYAQARARLGDELRHATNGVTLLGSDHWAFHTPLRIWALPFNSILLQGRRPATIATFEPPGNVVFDRTNRVIRFGEIPHMSIASAGWFKFDGLLETDREPARHVDLSAREPARARLRRDADAAPHSR